MQPGCSHQVFTTSATGVAWQNYEFFSDISKNFIVHITTVRTGSNPFEPVHRNHKFLEPWTRPSVQFSNFPELWTELCVRFIAVQVRTAVQDRTLTPLVCMPATSDRACAIFFPLFSATLNSTQLCSLSFLAGDPATSFHTRYPSYDPLLSLLIILFYHNPYDISTPNRAVSIFIMNSPSPKLGLNDAASCRWLGRTWLRPQVPMCRLLLQQYLDWVCFIDGLCLPCLFRTIQWLFLRHLQPAISPGFQVNLLVGKLGYVETDPSR